MGDYNSRYKRNDIEEQYLIDSNDIENFRQQQAQDVIDNFMLGDFNSDGNYVVDKSIINELINTTKVVTDVYGDFRFCQSTKKFDGIGHIQFAVDFSSTPENGQAVAVLVLLESMKACNGYIDNTNGVSIARFVGNNDKYFVERALKYFYVFLPDEIEGATFTENDRDSRFTNILARLYYLKSIKSLTDPFINRIEKDTFKKKAKTLTENKKGKEVVSNFVEEQTSVADKFLDKEKEDYYKMLNTLLDKTLAKHEGKIKEDKELSTTLKDIDNTKRINSKKAIDFGERETVDNKLSQNAEDVYNKKRRVKESKGTSPVAIYKEQKKSYQEIENNEKMELDQRENAKNKAKASGPRLLGKKEKITEPNLDETKQSVSELDGKKVPGKLASKPSFLKNDRYEEIKNSELKGDKISKNPTPYSKGAKNENIDSRQLGSEQQNRNQNATQMSEKEALLRELLSKDSNENVAQQGNIRQQTQTDANTQTQINTNSKPQINNQSASQTKQQTATATKTQTATQTSTQQNTQTDINAVNNNMYYDPRFPNGRPYNPYGPNPYGPRGPYNPYGPNPYGPYGPHNHGDSPLDVAVDILTGGFGDNKPMRPGMMPIGPRPTAPVQTGPSVTTNSFDNGKDFGQVPEQKGPQVTPGGIIGGIINEGIDLVNEGIGRLINEGPDIVRTPGLEVGKPHHIDSTPVFSNNGREDIYKEIFGSGIYDIERPKNVHQGQNTFNKQEEDEKADAFVHVHIKH